MDFSFSLTVPANTAEGDAVEDEVTLAAGKITEVWIMLPFGHAGLAHYQVHHRLQQLWPSNPGGSYSGNDTVIEFQEEYLLDEPPYVLRLRGWNTDDTYPHTAYFRFTLEPLAVTLAKAAQVSFLGRLKELLGL